MEILLKDLLKETIEVKVSSRKFFCGVSLITGTSIGAAALALPVVSSGLGFWGTLCSFFICWLVMYYAGLMVGEVSIHCGSEKSFISMTEYTLGRKFRYPIGFAYLILLYSLLAAYFRGGADLIHSILDITKILPPMSIVEAIPFVLVTFIIVYRGAGLIDLLNRIMVIGLVVSFFTLIISCFYVVNLDFNIIRKDFNASLMLQLLPVIITAFGYQVVIPSVRHYLEDNVNLLPRIILVGSLIPFILYFIWSILIYKALPYSGVYSIESLGSSAHPAVDLPLFLYNIYNQPLITNSISSFAFFALTSSILGIAISLFDFLADRLLYAKHNFNRITVVILTVIPPALFSFFYPEGFMMALSLAGIFVAILNGILPVLMIFKLRRKKGIPNSFYDYAAMLFVLLISCILLMSGFF